MKYFTANEARNAVNEHAQYGHVGSALTSLLQRIKELAESGGRQTISEGVGSAVDLPALVAALQRLGYSVQDLSHQSTPGGSEYLNRTIQISW